MSFINTEAAIEDLLSLQNREVFAPFVEENLQEYAQYLALMLEIYNSMRDPFKDQTIRSISRVVLFDIVDHHNLECIDLSDEIIFRLLSIAEFPHLNDNRGVAIIDAMMRLLKALRGHMHESSYGLSEDFLDHRLKQIALISTAQIDKFYQINVDPSD